MWPPGLERQRLRQEPQRMIQGESGSWGPRMRKSLGRVEARGIAHLPAGMGVFAGRPSRDSTPALADALFLCRDWTAGRVCQLVKTGECVFQSYES